MIIHPPEITKENGEIKVSARIETSKAIPNFPDTLWFSFPETNQPYITPRSEAFLLAMLVPAMYLNEDIEVRGTISPKLALNLQEFIYIYHQAFGLDLIGFTASDFKAFEPKGKPEAVVLSFSGGVNSMYTLYENLPENQPIKEGQITHGLLIHGFNDFDIALRDHGYFNRVYTRCQNLYDQLGLTLLTGKTNAYAFSKFRIDWNIGHTPTIAAFPYLLSNFVKVFYFSASGGDIQKKNFDPYQMSNHLLSSENLDIAGHTATVNRVEKMEAIARWPLAHDNLRVCLTWDKTEVSLNCGACFKCLATMVLLEILGVYEKFTAFPQPYQNNSIIKYYFLPYQGTVHLMHFVKYSNKHRRYDIIFWFALFYFPNRLRAWLLDKFNQWVPDKYKYQIRERFFGKRGFDLSGSGDE